MSWCAYVCVYVNMQIKDIDCQRCCGIVRGEFAGVLMSSWVKCNFEFVFVFT